MQRFLVTELCNMKWKCSAKVGMLDGTSASRLPHRSTTSATTTHEVISNTMMSHCQQTLSTADTGEKVQRFS